MIRTLALVVVALALSGCFERIAIKPDQLAALSDMPTPMQVAQSGHKRVIAVPTATVKTPEGLLVEIRSPYDAIVTLMDGATFDFRHPVRTTLTPSGFVVASGNRAETPFTLKEILAVEVTQPDYTKTFLATFGGSLAFGGILALVVMTAIQH